MCSERKEEIAAVNILRGSPNVRCQYCPYTYSDLEAAGPAASDIGQTVLLSAAAPTGGARGIIMADIAEAR